MQTLNLVLPVPAVQQILDSLTKLPYADVAGLIREIERQGTEQLQAAAAAQQAAPNPGLVPDPAPELPSAE